MSISRIKKQGDLGTFQVLLEIATTLEQILSNPDAIRKAAREAYNISDEHEAESIAHKDLITKSDAAASEARKQQAILDEKMAEYAKTKASIDSIMESIKKEQARLAKVAADYGEKALKLNELDLNLKAREATLSAGTAKLSKDNDLLAQRATKVAEEEAILKDKIQKLRGVVDA